MVRRSDLYREVKLIKSPTQGIAVLAGGISLCLLPLLLSGYQLFVVNFVAINTIVALGLNLLIGYAGQVSLGHAGFVAIGAYVLTLGMTELGLPFPVALVCAGLVNALFGFLLGLPALRLEGPYLAIATLGFGMTVTQVIGRWSLLGGHMGLQAPELFLGGWHLDSDAELYALLIPVTLLLLLAANNLTRSKTGRAWIALRDSEIAAPTLGIDVAAYKTLAFAVSAFYAGIAGGLWVFVLGYINPSMFHYFLSIMFLAMIVVGGVGSHSGSVLGAGLLTWLDLQLQNPTDLPVLGPLLVNFSERFMDPTGTGYVRFILFGLVLTVVVMWEPRGLHGIWQRFRMKREGARC